jgi:hypothetical protein
MPWLDILSYSFAFCMVLGAAMWACPRSDYRVGHPPPPAPVFPRPGKPVPALPAPMTLQTGAVCAFTSAAIPVVVHGDDDGEEKNH